MPTSSLGREVLAAVFRKTLAVRLVILFELLFLDYRVLAELGHPLI